MDTRVERKTCTASDGVPLVYSVAGTGEPALVFVHGALANRGFWQGEFVALAGRHRIIALDLPGHGESGANRQHWGVPDFGRDVQSVVDAERPGKIVIFGNSLGGPVAIEAALCMPGRVLGVVGVDTFHALHGVITADMARQRVEEIRSDYTGAVRQMVKALFHPDTDRALLEDVERRMSGTPADAACGIFLSLIGYDPAAAVGRLAVPLRAINGDVYPTDIEANRKVKPDFDAVVMAHTGHYPMLERPEAFDRLVEAVVAELAGAAPAM